MASNSGKQKCRPVKEYNEAKLNPYKTKTKSEPKLTRLTWFKMLNP